MDRITKEQRSVNMSKIRSNNTKPELLVRKALWQHKCRYRLYPSSLPGKPDIFISKYRTAIFIHGCFWHQHQGCKRNFIPKSNLDYWKDKLKNNTLRFDKNKKSLQDLDIKVIVVWECEINSQDKLNNVTENILSAIKRQNPKEPARDSV
ncbi:MAG: DNA mismatch endonuclease Vsr [Armatimonadetes bacterium]|nr:MAG: DNA mismatch endonuclease Vsr [Armatimonadota bacterium]